MRAVRTFGAYLRRRYPFPVRKLALDAGFGCPNRDGSRGTGGCRFCENRSFNQQGPEPVRLQIERGMDFFRRHFGAERFIAYFQAYSNTYAPVRRLRAMYEQALEYPNVVGLAVGTRPDCVSAAVVDLLRGYARDVDVWLELGLESSHDRTLAALNRGHTVAEFLRAVDRARGLNICVHAIFGLPGESHDEMMRTADLIAALGVESIKIHHLYVSPGTALEADYRRGDVRVMTWEEWIALAADGVERLPATMTVQRLAGELRGPYVIAPRWGRTSRDVLRAVDAELARRRYIPQAARIVPMSRNIGTGSGREGIRPSIASAGSNPNRA